MNIALTADTLARISGRPVNDNMRSIVLGLDAYGDQAGLNKPHRLAHYLAQLGHESMGFHYDREVWGPTAAQSRYEGRKDLGNTQPGDGKKFSGKGPIQITGRANATAFRDWCRAQGLNAPDFAVNPDLINTDPWEGLGPIWYWSTRNLNRYADANDIETLTKRINGGLNGFADRLNWYTRAGLALLGYAPSAIRQFQADAQLAGHLPAGANQVDGDAGPKTRAALHMMLSKLTPEAEVKAAPVVEETAVPVVPKGAQNTIAQRAVGAVGVLAPAAGLFAGFNQTGIMIMVGLGILAVIVLLIRGEQIAARAKAVLKSFDEPAT